MASKKTIPHVVKKQLVKYLRQSSAKEVVPLAKGTQFNIPVKSANCISKAVVIQPPYSFII